MTTGIIGLYLNGRDGGVQFPKPHMPPTRWSLWLAWLREAARWALGGCGG